MSDYRNEISDSSNNKGFFKKLSSGDFGLAKTYWLYGVVVGVVVNLATKPVTSAGLLVVILLAYAVYEAMVLMGVWRAASKYQGLKLWAVLAKIAVVLGVLMLAVTILATLTLMGQV